MEIRILAAALVVGTAAAAPAAVAPGTAAGAQELACGSREEMTERLKQSFGEAQTGRGLVSAARILEVWSSDETGTWTILMTDADGRSCLLAAGRSWQKMPFGAFRAGDPA